MGGSVLDIHGTEDVQGTELETRSKLKVFLMKVFFRGLVGNSGKGDFLIKARTISEAYDKAGPELERVAGDERQVIVESIKETKYEWL